MADQNPKSLLLDEQQETLRYHADRARQHARDHGLQEHENLLARAALLAHFDMDAAEVTETERKVLVEEKTHRFKQSWTMIGLAMTVALCACVQGMDESVLSGAGLFYPTDLKLEEYTSISPALLEGLIGSAPYLAAGAVGCWIAVPLNNWIGRRWTIFGFEIINVASCLWQAFAPSWQHLFAGRFVMGLSIGAKSATAPVYTSETAPAILRGGLVMLWQTFTAFGVMMGTVMGIAFFNVSGNWRYMFGSPCVPPILVATAIFFLPESPRWLVLRGKHPKALRSLMRVRRCDLAAARDYLLIIEGLHTTDNKALGMMEGFRAMATQPRCRSASVAAFTLMVLQQMCGINILTFYISTILVSGGFTQIVALGGSVGFGALAWIGNLCAIPLIDRAGRRSLTLWTFPLMAITLLAAGLSFLIPAGTGRVAAVLFFIYLYTLAYAFGEGPVPFTYSAEVFPLEIRSLGMAFGTATTWIFCWALSLSLPSCLESLGNIGTFGLYTGFCVLGYFFIFFLVPESKQYTLEELDRVFSVGVTRHATFQTQAAMQRFGLYNRAQPKMELLAWATREDGAEAAMNRSTAEEGATKDRSVDQHVENASSSSA